ncbi:hypothetical protein PI125_g3696 [Phytophthora idaei]|nr:hypothetical protein PI125_g3696 [Phytophthora idaei]
MLAAWHSSSALPIIVADGRSDPSPSETRCHAVAAMVTLLRQERAHNQQCS